MTRKSWTLLTVCIATFMLLLDITVVNTALPSIKRDLHATLSGLEWVVDAYALTLAAFVLTGGALADRLGRRRLFVAGMATFTLGSLACALAPDATILNLARGLQGVGAAGMFAVSLALLAHAFPGPERAAALGIYGATIGMAAAVGPLVGGALTDGLGWRSIFYVNVPVGAATIALARRKVEESRDPRTRRIDWPGQATFAAALGLAVLALLRGNAWGWGSTRVVALIAAAVALSGLFVLLEARRRDPMLPLELFRVPAFTGAQIAGFALSASLFACLLYTTLYLQDVLGYGPLEAGLRYLPFTVTSFFVSPPAARLLGKVSAGLLLAAGLTCVAIALAVMSTVSAGSGWTVLLPGFVVAGVGTGIVLPVLADVSLRSAPPDRSGLASGANNTFRQVGLAAGIAGLGAVYSSSGGPIDGLHTILEIATVIAVAGAVFALALVRPRHLRGPAAAPAAAA